MLRHVQELLSLLLPGVQRSPLAAAATPDEAASAATAAAVAATAAVAQPAAAGEEGRAAVSPALADTLRCRLTGKLLQDPWIASDGYTYEGAAIRARLAAGSLASPATGLPLEAAWLRPNHAVRDLLESIGHA